jgi:peptidoglycan hydrolase-like protein with peptidoglycan-binding domain
MHNKLRAGIAAAALALIPVADATAASYGSRTLKTGMSGSDVKAFQGYLDDAGYETATDGEYGPATARSMRSFEKAEGRRANGAASPKEQLLVQTRAEEAPAEPPPVEATEDAYLDANGLAVAPASAPAEVQAIIAAANEIATEPYKYGGGHVRGFKDRGYDCSGSISYALHAADLLDSPLDSGAFMSWGERGRGEWVTIRTNPSHAYMIVAGLRFDTSARKRTGNRWSETMRSARGYTARHPEGL